MAENTKKVRAVLFAGGRGSASISAALSRHPQIELSILVNAYDDGLSTGRLRRFVPGMLGPSDVRKNICTLISESQRSLRALKGILEFRLPQETLVETGRGVLNFLGGIERTCSLNQIAEMGRWLEVHQTATIRSWVNAFLDYERREERAGTLFSYHDTAIGNLLFTGCFLLENRDFNRATERFSSFCEVKTRVLNITDGSNQILCALKEDGRFVPDEAALVSPQDSVPIEEIFLLNSYLAADSMACLELTPSQNRRSFLSERMVFPNANPDAIRALESADLIIYGPGTQHSSLLPSYMTRNVVETILANTKAEKVFVANIAHDHDIPNRSVHHLLDNLEYYLSRKGEIPSDLNRVVTRLFAQIPDRSLVGSTRQGSYLPFDLNCISLKPNAVTAIDWEEGAGQHCSGRIVDELLHIAQQLVDVQIVSYRHTVSIVIPVLDELATLDRVLGNIQRLDLGALEVNKEVIVVDGGSTDGSFEYLKNRPYISLFRLPSDKKGRGSAIRLGLEKARGNVVVIFPADNEYSSEDIMRVAAPVIANEFQIVFGIRAINWEDLDATLQKIHGPDRVGRLMSKYGGFLSSVICLMLFKRFISDPFTTLKAIDARLAKRLSLKSKGVDLEMELIAKSRQVGQYILEVPVRYNPRPRSAGKKTKALDGILALYRLFYCWCHPINLKQVSAERVPERLPT